MGCGCKNKNNSNQQPTQQSQPTTQSAPTQQSVQETIKKTIEKYYTVNKSKG
jgi:DNA-binding protein Fis